MLPGRGRGCYWGRWPVKPREKHRDLVIHTSTKDLLIPFQGLLQQKALWHAKQACDPSLRPHKNSGVVQKKNRNKNLILPSNLGISERNGKTAISCKHQQAHKSCGPTVMCWRYSLSHWLMIQHLIKKNNWGYLPNLKLNVQVLSGIKINSRASVSKKIEIVQLISQWNYVSWW